MNWSDIPRNPSRAVLRQFAGLWIVFFGTLALYHGVSKGDAGRGIALAALAFTIGPVGLLAPALMRPIFVGWMIAVFPLAWIISRAVLACLFYGVFTPLACVFRLAGRDALALRRAPGRQTYWIDKPAAPGAQRYFRQF